MSTKIDFKGSNFNLASNLVNLFYEYIMILKNIFLIVNIKVVNKWYQNDWEFRQKILMLIKLIVVELYNLKLKQNIFYLSICIISNILFIPLIIKKNKFWKAILKEVNKLDKTWQLMNAMSWCNNVKLFTK